MGIVLSSQQIPSTQPNNVNTQQQSRLKSYVRNQNLNDQLFEMKQLNKNLLAEYNPFQSIRDDSKHPLQPLCDDNKHIVESQEKGFIQVQDKRKNIIKQIQTKHQLQDHYQIKNLTFQMNIHQQQRSIAQIAQRVSSQYTSFRSSFMSDQSQSSIYLEPPQFILRSSTLMNALNRTLMEFFDFSQFLGEIAIKIYNFGLYFLFLILVFNFFIVYCENFECLKVKNGGFIELDKWFLMDSIVSVFAIVLLWIQNYYTHIYRYKLRRMKINKKITVIQNSWIILYAFKYFFLNAVGSIQFFTYIAHQNEAQTNLVSELSSLPSSTITKCPELLNCYIMGVIIYNYLSVILLGVFVMENII